MATSKKKASKKKKSIGLVSPSDSVEPQTAQDEQGKASDLKGPDFQHCLRPEFTKNLYRDLVSNRRSCNLVGLKGQGKTRLIQDLKKLKLPENVRILDVNLGDYKKDFSKLLEHIARRVGFEGELEGKKFDSLVREFFQKFPDTYLVLIIDNYDSICNRVEKHPSYNRDFESGINSLKNDERISLFCTSENPIKGMSFFEEIENPEGESKQTQRVNLGSIIDLSPMPLPTLIEEEIYFELNRDTEINNFFTSHPALRKYLIADILEHQLPCPFLEHSIMKLRLTREREEFRKEQEGWIRNLKKEFEKMNSIGIDKKIHKTQRKIQILKERGVDILKLFLTIQKATTTWGKIGVWMQRAFYFLLALGWSFYDTLKEWFFR
jgi:hypothetical protein